MVQTTGRNLPPPQSAFIDKLLNLSSDGYQYLLSLLAIAATAIPTASINTGLVATGTNQATALQLSAQWNEVDTIAAGTGVLLQALQPGQSQAVFNEGANALNVYPPPGFKIDASAINVAVLLAPTAKRTFDFVSTTQIR